MLAPVNRAEAPEDVFTANFRQLDDQRPILLRIWHIIEACFQMLLHIFKMLSRWMAFVQDDNLYLRPVVQADGKYQFDLTQLPWKEDDASEGLYLFIHGLGGRPYDWDCYLHTLKRSQAHCLAPHIPFSGRCSLEDAAAPLLPIIENYLAKFPAAPIRLIGTSNGGRIASYLEVHLKPELMEGHPLSVVSIAGIHGGTYLMDYVGYLRFHPEIVDNLSYNSLFSQKLLLQWQEKQQQWVERGIQVLHRFYATTEDEQVRPVASALPFLPNTSDNDYRIVHGQTHMTIVDAVCENVFQPE